MKKSKAFLLNQKKVDRDKLYDPNNAFSILKSFSDGKSDQSIEVHFNLGIDPRHADQQLRGTFALPNGTGKSKVILVLDP